MQEPGKKKGVTFLSFPQELRCQQHSALDLLWGMSRTFQKERESVGIVVLREGEQNFSKPRGWLCLGKWEGEEVGDAVG